jgi:hypothetical protein
MLFQINFEFIKLRFGGYGFTLYWKGKPYMFQLIICAPKKAIYF